VPASNEYQGGEHAQPYKQSAVVEGSQWSREDGTPVPQSLLPDKDEGCKASKIQLQFN